MLSSKFLRAVLISSAILALLRISTAQTSAVISGTVMDATGASIVAAIVHVKSIETGADRRILTDSAGRYTAPALSVGVYEVRAEASGFRPALKTNISLVVGQARVVDLTLELKAVTASVTVEALGHGVDTSTQDVSGLVGEKQVKDLPLNGRSYDQLLSLNPDTVNYTSERSGGVGVSNSAVGNMFAVSGRRPQQNLFLLNGIEFTGASEINLTPGGASGELLGVDAVREFNVVRDAYDAEYGKRAGAQVSIVTASGDNELHGTAYEFLRNSALDARNFFDRGAIPPFDRNEFGAALGGPIRKNKTFAFVNYEGLRQQLGLSDVTLVPDRNARRGLLPASNASLINVGVAASVVPLLNLWPAQNGPDLGGGIGEAFANPIQTIHDNFGTTRLDHTFSQPDSIFGVYTIDDSADITPTANPLSLDLERLREQVWSVQETHLLSNSAITTQRVGFSRASYFFTGETGVSAPGFISGEPVGAIVVGGGTAANAAAQLSPAGSNVGSNLTAVRNLLTYENRFDLTKRNHQIAAGIWLQRIQANDDMAQAQYGQASFSSLANLLKGVVSTFTAVPSPTEMGWRSLESAFYIQDAVKLARNFELSAGLRVESTDGWNEVHHRASNYVFGANGVIATLPRIGASAFTKNNSSALFEPRLGLAWDPFNRKKTVIHAGFGMYHDLLDDLSYRLDQNPPFNTTITLKNLPLSALPLTAGETQVTGGKISPSGIQPDAQTPAVISYTLKVEQELFAGTVVEAGYVGSRGYHQLITADANEPVPVTCPAVPCPSALPAGTVYYAPGSPLANPLVANTTTWLSEGISSHNAFQIDVRHHQGRGLQLRASYTWARSLDDGTALNSSVAANAPGFVMFPLNPRLDWGLSTFDVRHQASFSGVYDLPLGRARASAGNSSEWKSKVFGGWSLAWIASVQSGFPFTPQLGFNPANNGDTRNPVRPSYNPAFTGGLILGDPSRYFDPNAFVIPANGTYGNVGRDTLIGPGLALLDVSLLKQAQISEKLNLQFRAEAFNMLNHANFGTPNPVVFTQDSSAPSSIAGLITSTSTTSRQIQLGLKVIW